MRVVVATSRIAVDRPVVTGVAGAGTAHKGVDGAGVVPLGGLYADPTGAMRRAQARRPQVSA